MQRTTCHFMQDNNPKHSSGFVRSCSEENNINMLKWSAKSPDLNPIENLRNDVNQHVVRAKPKNLTDLWTEIEKAWYVISVERCVGLAESMTRRLTAVIKNNGYSTKYHLTSNIPMSANQSFTVLPT